MADTSERNMSALEDMVTLDEIQPEDTQAIARSTRPSSISSWTSQRIIEQKIQARAKAEAARVSLDYLRREAQLRKRVAEIQERETLAKAKSDRERKELAVDIDLIKEERTLAETLAEAEVYESELSSRLLTPSITNNLERTKQYIEDLQLQELNTECCSYSVQSECHNHASTQKVSDDKEDGQISPEPVAIKQEQESLAESSQKVKSKNLNGFLGQCHEDKQVFPVPVKIERDQERPAKSPQEGYLGQNLFNSCKENLSSNHNGQGTILNQIDLNSFFMRRDLAISRLTNFNDQADTYLSWKASFKSIMEESKISASEEIDLLVKWLGPTSSRHACSIRSSNASNPSEGLLTLWQRLDMRYGSPEAIEAALKNKIINFPRITPQDSSKLFEFLDILDELKNIKSNPQYSVILAYYDSPLGINELVAKLPARLQIKWTDKAAGYKRKNHTVFPPFEFFVDFVAEMSSVLNDPGLNLVVSDYKGKSTNSHTNKAELRVRKTEIEQVTKPKAANNESSCDNRIMCPIHNAPHSLNDCKVFNSKSFEERKQFIREKGICYKCGESDAHLAKKCDVKVSCSVCQGKHPTCLHRDQGGERAKSYRTGISSSSCLKSCAKIVLVKVYLDNRAGGSKKVYALLDDQSNRSLISPQLLDYFQIHGPEVQYTLSSCAGSVTAAGRRSSDFWIESLDGECALKLPTLIECGDIPNDPSEIPTPGLAEQFPHLTEAAQHIPPLDPTCNVDLLIGRDLIRAHHVLKQLTGDGDMPFAQKTPLGWVVVGNVTCLGKIHRPSMSNVKCFKTYLLHDGRRTIFEPCEKWLDVKEISESEIFERTPDDEKLGWSIEDREFESLMSAECKQNEQGFWTAPLPFRAQRQRLPNNRQMAWNRAQVLDRSLKRDPVKRCHFVEFMKRIFVSRAAEVAPVTNGGEVWYLPLFGVYNPKKPGKIRGVFDSSAEFRGVSLNSILISGPNLTNNLVSILLRFRKNKYAVCADIEQMFYKFLVNEEHRDFLRFFWYRDNNPELELIEYRMCVHVFGNSPSPAVATFALRRAVASADLDVQQFVNRDFYVDDALTSRRSATESVDILKRTQRTLEDNGHIRLHKIVSNSPDIMKAFPEDDLSVGLKSLDLEYDSLPTQRSLGMTWNLNSDTFDFEVNMNDDSSTRRQMLSILNSVFDPLGFLSPFTIQGKLLLRELTTDSPWDEVIPKANLKGWDAWKQTMMKLNMFKFPRMIVPVSLDQAEQVELHIFSDASEKAVAAVGYIKLASNGQIYTGFTMGKTKLAPQHGNTIPRLELCAAVLATELGENLSEALDIPLEKIFFYTDSRVVLGYINNKTRRFYTYVSNRVYRILRNTNPQQWSYIASQQNPADQATRTSMTVEKFDVSLWVKGPDKLKGDPDQTELSYPLLQPTEDKEIRPEVKTKKTVVHSDLIQRFNKFSSWSSLMRAICVLKRAVRNFKSRSSNSMNEDICLKQETELTVIKMVQEQAFEQEICLLQDGQKLKKCVIKDLSPYLDGKGVLRVGGRLNTSYLPIEDTNPIILPNSSHVTHLIALDQHERVHHQGRLITESAIRTSGYWIVGAKRLVGKMIKRCVKCRKLRGQFQWQQMANLPIERIQPSPPFTNIGVDTFGPWSIVTRKTRGGSANSKRWAILFTCLATRAVHIEVVEEMSTSSFINALRRFIALRGNVKEIRSDCGTNFIGAARELKLDTIHVKDPTIQSYLSKSNIVWKFNPPHSSHMGGVWERMIGLARKVLDSMLLGPSGKNLTHETLVTLMCEVCAILNSRPIGPISTDPESPLIISPAFVLNQKSGRDLMQDLSFDLKDIYKAQWRRVQALSDIFWKEWQKGYIQTLQSRQKWESRTQNVKIGDVVLIKDKDLSRSDWQVGVVCDGIKSQSDDQVRKVEVRVAKDGKANTYTRPISDLILLLED